MCICVCICANNKQILGFGGVGGLGVGGGYHWGGVWGSGDRAHIYRERRERESEREREIDR